MKLYAPKELSETTGSMMLLYGDTGVGKSVTTIQTAPDPIIYIMAEGRDVTKMLLAANRPDVKIKFGFYTTWDDMMETVANPENFKGARTLVIDSLTHLISICLSDEILVESFDALDKKKEQEKKLTMQVKMSQESYGTLAGHMLRFTNLITKLTQDGLVVVCIARTESNPKFNRALSGSPALKGQEYGKHMQGFFDYIGYIEQRIEDEGVAYPPYVSFESDGSFMAKWCGLMPKNGVYRKPLDIAKIVEISAGKKVKKEKKGGGEESKQEE